jgi:hypothetical protein
MPVCVRFKGGFRGEIRLKKSPEIPSKSRKIDVQKLPSEKVVKALFM